jgi:hypothetical protein
MENMKTKAIKGRTKWYLAAIVIVIVGIAVTWIRTESTNGAASGMLPHEHRPRELSLPENGCIPDTSTAVKIAEAIWLPVYGERIYEKRPFKAELLGDSIWIVAGTLPKNSLGGVPYIELRRSNAEVIGIAHGK